MPFTGIWDSSEGAGQFKTFVCVEDDESDRYCDEKCGGMSNSSLHRRIIFIFHLQHDTQLVSVLYRTHKSLSTTAAKISSLYVFDALSRAAKHHSTKHGLTGDAFTQPGNSASFLFKVGGVVEGLFQDMIATGSVEAKVSLFRIEVSLSFVRFCHIRSIRSKQSSDSLFWAPNLLAWILPYLCGFDALILLCLVFVMRRGYFHLFDNNILMNGPDIITLGKNEEDPWYLGKGEHVSFVDFVSVVRCPKRYRKRCI